MYTQGDMATGAPYHPTTGTTGGPGAHAAADAAGAIAALPAGARAADSAGIGGNSSPVFIASTWGVDGKSASGEWSDGVLMVEISAAPSSSANEFLFLCSVYTYSSLGSDTRGGQLSTIMVLHRRQRCRLRHSRARV